MILKEQPITLKLKSILNFFFSKINKIVKIFFIVIALAFAYILGDEHGSHSKNVELKYKILRIYQFFKNVSYDYFAINTKKDFDTYTLNINFEEFSKLQKMRDKAVKAKILLPEHKKKIKGKIQFNNKSEKNINLRLRGFETSHVEDPKKWSFRVNITNNNKSSYNQKYKKFSLMHASRRFFIYEWIYHQALKDNGILSPDYEFIKFREVFWILDPKYAPICRIKYSFLHHFFLRIEFSNRQHFYSYSLEVSSFQFQVLLVDR